MELSQKQLEDIVKGVTSHIDVQVEERLKTFLGNDVAASVSKTVKEMRLGEILSGKPVCSDEEKMAFVNGVKSIVLNTKANEPMILENDARGGYLVPTAVANVIVRLARTVGFAFSQATRWDMSDVKELDVPAYTGSALEGEWLEVDSAGGDGQAVAFKSAKLALKTWQITFVVGKNLLSKASVSLADWLIALAAEALANSADKQLLTGSGSPFVGVLNHDDVTTYTLGTGQTTAASYKVIDDSSEIMAQVEESALDGACFVVHKSVWAKWRVQKDTAGNYLLPQAGLLPMFLGADVNAALPRAAGLIMDKPVYTVRHMTAAASATAGTTFGVFGNFRYTAYGESGPMTIEQHASGNFGGKEVARSAQRGIVLNKECAFNVTLPEAFIKIKTAAS